MRRKLITLLLLVFALQLAATTIIRDFDFGNPTIKEEGEFSTVNMEDSFFAGATSLPALPYRTLSLYLPTGEEIINVTVKRSGRTELETSLIIKPVQQQYPLSRMDEALFTEPNSEVYNSTELFPQTAYSTVRTTFVAGHSIGTLSVTPFEYSPKDGKLAWYSDVTVVVETSTTAKGLEAQQLRKNTKSVYDRISNTVDNPQDMNFSYNYRNDGVNYLIIYPEAYLAHMNVIANYHQQRNRNVMLLSMEDIQANPVPNGATFIDLQEKIREYIKYYYSLDANDIQYVLLAGDDDVIPHRGFWANNDAAEDFDIPADNYYSNLDGNFDTDGDGVWGESMEADLGPELAIGRICYNSTTELDNILNKIYKFTEEPVVNLVETSFFCGEWLWEGPTYGGDYMDELIGSVSSNGYATTGYPTDWSFTKLYDRDEGGEESWYSNNLYPFLTAGPTYINHLGHSNTTYNMRMSNSLVTNNNIGNDGVNGNYSVHFSQGCYAGAFDNRGTNTGQYGEDCITEKFTALENSAVAMISNTRYGWGVQGSTNGASQYFHREWSDAMFNENITTVGESLVDSKLDNIPRITEATMYWCYYQTALFGDPAMALWTATPQAIDENISTVWTFGQPSYSLDITTEDVTACFINDANEVIWAGERDILGNFVLSTTSTLLQGNYTLKLFAENHLPTTLNIEVIGDDSVFLATNNVEPVLVNSVYSAGESIGFNLDVENFGTEGFTGESYVRINTNSEFLTVVEDSLYIGNIAGNSSVTFTDVFDLLNNGGYPEGTTAVIEFLTYFNDISSSYEKTITLNAASLSISALVLQSDGIAPPAGEITPFDISVTNSGSGYTSNVNLFLYTYANGITLSPANYTIDIIAPGETIVISDVFEMNIASTVQDGDSGNIVVSVVDPFFSTFEYNYDFIVGLDAYTFETGFMGFITEQPISTFVNQWHVSSSENHTTNGSQSLKFGGTGNSNYANSAYGFLVSPSFNVVPGSQLIFHHRMDAERDGTNSSYAWDGGFVEMSLNGGSFTQITPIGNYPFYIRDNNDSAIAGSTPVYSGNFSWSLAEFNLGNVSGSAQFRFVFGSDGYTAGEGWYIDDMIINLPTENSSDNLLPVLSMIKGNYPNPFNPETTIEYAVSGDNAKDKKQVVVEIYNVKGQKVKTLVNDKKTPGNYKVTWTGDNESGHSVASGLYFTKLKVDSKQDTRKMILMK
ncbi:MAG: hypothetical protein B6226_02430 [Candidatus Cloacimonetes bacterium 4572_65]|nr:MAG: hypothetical protein B6226_02430 [Candidatus Cloacimonetes bacterium 4572_65]